MMQKWQTSSIFISRIPHTDELTQGCGYQLIRSLADLFSKSRGTLEIAYAQTKDFITRQGAGKSTKTMRSSAVIQSLAKMIISRKQTSVKWHLHSRIPPTLMN